MALSLQFVNQTGLPDDQVFVTFQNPSLGDNDFSVSYGGRPLPIGPKDIMSSSLSLAQIGGGGLVVDQAVSVAVFVSYGLALTAGTRVPSFFSSSGPDYLTRFQPFELTMNGGATDQGNLTAINYFTAPMSIASYPGGGGTPLQSKGYSQTAAQIATAIQALTTQSEVKTSAGDVVRYIGPSSYGPTDSNPFPSFVPYLQAVHTAGQSTKIQNANGFVQPSTGGEGSTNYLFSLNLVATMASDGSISMDGSITTEVTPYGEASSPGPTFDDCSVDISASDTDLLDFVIYGQAIASAVTFGSGWDQLETYMQSVGLDSATTLSITQNLAVGEITTGLSMGFVGSSTVPAGGSTKIENMPSDAWWSLDPMIAFSRVQPTEPYYNPYANIIYDASNNEAYSIPYSDRLGTGPLINSVSCNGQPVDTWVVTLEPPIS